jgi:hypothetical protein
LPGSGSNLATRWLAIRRQVQLKPGRDGAGKNLISDFVASAKAEAVHAQTQRMRSTWPVQQMSACAPLPELVEAAGVDWLAALARYLTFVPKASTDIAASRLRAA